jgi:hypothetical protein
MNPTNLIAHVLRNARGPVVGPLTPRDRQHVEQAEHIVDALTDGGYSIVQTGVIDALQKTLSVLTDELRRADAVIHWMAVEPPVVTDRQQLTDFKTHRDEAVARHENRRSS